MSTSDETKRLLEELLAQLHNKQAHEAKPGTKAFLRAKDGQFLGNINSNRFDRESLINKYGPFGSKYSQTSIFNKYSKYGSRYGLYSMNNPSCINPPELVVDGHVVAKISSNPRISNRIDPDSFVATLESNPNLLLQGKTVQDPQDLRRAAYSAYIEAEDGTFLGKLNPNEYDPDSIFNEYGNFGSAYSPTSIFNEYSNYGGEYAAQSPFNSYSSTPPKVFLDGKFAGFLSVNEYVSPRIDPRKIKEWASRNIAQFG